MGLLDFLSGKNAQLLELQKRLVYNSPNRLIFTEKQLRKMATDDAKNSLRIMNDTRKILRNTIKPDVFFSRLDLWIQHTENLKALEPFINLTGVSATVLLNETYKQKDSITLDFLRRYYRSISEKAKTMKTQAGKNNQYKKFYDSLQPFYGEMSQQCIDYMESIRKSSQ